MRFQRALLAVTLVALVAGCTGPAGSAPPPRYFEDVLGSAWPELVIEIDHAPGRAPSAEAVAHLTMTFENVTSKTRISVLTEASLAGTAKRWTADELRALEVETRTTTHAAPTAVLHVLYPAGEYERAGVGGVTIAGPVIGPAVVFLDTLRNYTLPSVGNGTLPIASPVSALPLPEDAVRIVERSTLLHEAGHAVGLVDNGLDMVCPHEDRDHEGHSSNPASVMYWTVDSMEGVRKMLLGEGDVPDRFDENDLRDLARGGGRGLPAPAVC